jgi:diguanylate cyclase (GGDEF)-like protein
MGNSLQPRTVAHEEDLGGANPRPRGARRWAELEVELSQTQDRLKRLSLVDTLTGLPSRNLFLDRLQQLIDASDRGGPEFALLMLASSRITNVSEPVVHDASGTLLARIAARLQQLMRKTDTCARWSGNAFAMLLVGTPSEAGAITVTERIAAALREPMLAGCAGLSIGIALYPEHGADGRTLLAAAECAMDVAQSAGRDYQVFSGNPPRESRAFYVNNRLTEALEHGELVLHYQPKLDLRSRDVVGFEALARWRSSRFGVIGPSEFVPAAERCGLVRPMTYRILDMALDQAKRCWDDGWRVSMAVNLSARLLDDATFADRVSLALEQRSLPPTLLTLELAAAAVMSNPGRVQEGLGVLRRRGVGVSLDDFGTGHTSLQHLRDLDISEIKIDKLFVSNLQYSGRDAWIVRAIAALGRGVEVDLVAEGIEDEATCAILRDLGCTLGQGFALGRPMPAEELSGWWRRRQSKKPAVKSAWS